jgi:type IX secretion system PorP/SprF family membrane protein
MKNNNIIVILLVIAASWNSVSAFSQQNMLSNQYVVNRFWLSPAYAGMNNKCNVFADFRREWMGINEAPVTRSFSADGLVGKNNGLGGSVTSTVAGIFTNLSAIFSYSYHLKLSTHNFIGIGVGAGFQENHLDIYQSESINDPVLNNIDRSSSYPIASFGILFKGKNLHLGFALPQLFSNKMISTPSYVTYQQSVSHMGYTLNIGNSWIIDPIVVVSKTQNSSLFYEMTCPIIFQQKVWVSPIYKKTSIGAGIGFNIKSNLVFNYTIEVYNHGLAHKSSGTHEITLGWKIKDKKKDILKDNNKRPYFKWVNK